MLSTGCGRLSMPCERNSLEICRNPLWYASMTLAKSRTERPMWLQSVRSVKADFLRIYLARRPNICIQLLLTDGLDYWL